MNNRIRLIMLVLILMPLSALGRSVPNGSILDRLMADVEARNIASATVYYLPYGKLRAFGLNAAMLRTDPDETCEVRMTDAERESFVRALRNPQVSFARTEGHDMHWGADFKDRSGNIRHSLFVGAQYPGEDFVAANFDGSFVNLNPAIARWFEGRYPHWTCRPFHR
jgi:hypothetical protein